MAFFIAFLSRDGETLSLVSRPRSLEESPWSRTAVCRIRWPDVPATGRKLEAGDRPRDRARVVSLLGLGLAPERVGRGLGRVRVGGHAVVRQRRDDVGARRVDVHLL